MSEHWRSRDDYFKNQDISKHNEPLNSNEFPDITQDEIDEMIKNSDINIIPTANIDINEVNMETERSKENHSSDYYCKRDRSNDNSDNVNKVIMIKYYIIC